MLSSDTNVHNSEIYSGSEETKKLAPNPNTKDPETYSDSEETEEFEPDTAALQQMKADLLKKLEKFKEYETKFDFYYHSLIVPDIEGGVAQHCNFAKKYYLDFRYAYNEITALKNDFLLLALKIQSIKPYP